MTKSKSQKPNSGDDLKVKAIGKAIQKIGNFQEFVRVWPDRESGQTVFNYKIDDKVPAPTADKLVEAIEALAVTTNFGVSQHI